MLGRWEVNHQDPARREEAGAGLAAARERAKLASGAKAPAGIRDGLMSGTPVWHTVVVVGSLPSTGSVGLSAAVWQGQGGETCPLAQRVEAPTAAGVTRCCGEAE